MVQDSFATARYLLASDLDGTVIPLEDTQERRQEIAEFGRSLRSRPEILLVYVTGRHFALAMEGVRIHRLPEPSLLACDVGTSLYVRHGTTYESDQPYRDLMERAFGGCSPGDIRGALTSLPDLELQEDEKQADFKVSYYFPAQADKSALLNEARRALGSMGARGDLISSYDPGTGRGLLDVLPSGIAKDFVIRYLHDRTGLDSNHLIYAGDSGNDLAAMLAGYHVIVVGNAPEQLKAHLREEGSRRGLEDRIFFARRPFAGGVLEGLRHFRVL